MQNRQRPPEPVHIQGIHKGEELALDKGREAGPDGIQYRVARHSTGINPEYHMPIHPAMPNIPTA